MVLMRAAQLGHDTFEAKNAGITGALVGARVGFLVDLTGAVVGLVGALETGARDGDFAASNWTDSSRRDVVAARGSTTETSGRIGYPGSSGVNEPNYIYTCTIWYMYVEINK